MIVKLWGAPENFGGMCKTKWTEKHSNLHSYIKKKLLLISPLLCISYLWKPEPDGCFRDNEDVLPIPKGGMLWSQGLRCWRGWGGWGGLLVPSWGRLLKLGDDWEFTQIQCKFYITLMSPIGVSIDTLHNLYHKNIIVRAVSGTRSSRCVSLKKRKRKIFQRRLEYFLSSLPLSHLIWQALMTADAGNSPVLEWMLEWKSPCLQFSLFSSDKMGSRTFALLILSFVPLILQQASALDAVDFYK